MKNSSSYSRCGPAALLMLALCACGGQTHGAAAPPAATDSPAPSGCLPGHDGYLRVRLRGARDLDIDWQDAQLQCDGGPRPHSGGVRVTFAGPRTLAGHRLRFVFGIAAVPAAGAGRDLPTNVTVIFEGDGKMYSTRGDDKFTVDVLEQVPVRTAAAPHARRVSARGFCIAPAAALEGGEDLVVSRFDFAGLVVDEQAPAGEHVT